jgi:hypothetical protein
MVPRKHNYHRAQLDFLSPTGKVGEVLEDVGTHRVVGEVMLHPPERLVAKRFCQIGEAKLVPINVSIGAPFTFALKDRGHPDVHLTLL